MRFEPSIALGAALRALEPVIVAFSLYLLFAGHNAPGGGFIGGLVGASAILLRFVAGGLPEPRPVLLRAHALLGTGLAIAVLVAMAGWLDTGSTPLDMETFERDVPVLGTVKATTALPFDIGVYLVVVGVMVAIVDGLGGSDDDGTGSDDGTGTDGEPPSGAGRRPSGRRR